MESLTFKREIVMTMLSIIFFDSYEQMKKPALRSLAIAHGISMLVGKMSSDNLRQSIVCHVGRGYCSFSKHSYERCDSVCKALHIESV